VPRQRAVKSTMTETGEVGRRERKKLKLRQDLVEAAYRLFEKKGFDETRIEDITNDVDVSARTFFRYFSCKEDVVLDYEAVEHDEIVAALAARPADEPILTALRAAAVEVTRGCEEGSYGVDGNRFKTLKALVRSHPLVAARSLEQAQGRKDMLVSGIAERMRVDPKRDVRPRVIASALEFAYSAAYDVWQDRGQDRVPYSDVLDEVFSLVEEGLNYRPAEPTRDP